MSWPACGLYRTGMALTGKESAVAADLLVYFHNHSEQGPPLVQLPDHNVHNRWSFAARGYLLDVEDAESFAGALVRLPPQGFYVVKERLSLADGRVLAQRTLVQVGYNRHGHPIVFPAAFSGNGFQFPERGLRFTELGIFDHLRHAGFDRPTRAPVTPPADGTDGLLLH